MKFANVMLAVAITVSSTHVVAKPNCDFFEDLTSSQHQVLQKSYSYGKEDGLGETLAALSIVESTAGVYLEGPSKRDGGHYGPFMVSLGNVLKREGGKKYKNMSAQQVLNKTPRSKRKAVIRRLKTDIAFAAKHAMKELNFWRSQTSTKRGMLQAYNGGYSAIGLNQRYPNKVQVTIKSFKQCKYTFKRKSNNLRLASR